MPSETGSKSPQSRFVLVLSFFTATLLRSYEMSELDHHLNTGSVNLLTLSFLMSLVAALLSDRASASLGVAPKETKPSLRTSGLAGLFYALYLVLWLKGLQMCGSLNVLLLETSDIALFAMIGGFLGPNLSGFAKVIGGSCMSMGYVLLMWSRTILSSPSRGDNASSHNSHPLNGIALILLSSFCYFMFHHFYKQLTSQTQSPMSCYRYSLFFSSCFLLPFALVQSLLYHQSASVLSTLWAGALSGTLIFFSPLLQKLYSHRLGERLHFMVSFPPAVVLTILLYFFQHGHSIDLVALMSCALIFCGHSIIYSLIKLPHWLSLGPIISHIWTSRVTKKLFVYFLINVSFMFVEFLVGILTNSLGMISDAGHMLFDSTALFLGLMASYMSSWPRNERYSYGYSRIEVLTGFVNAVFLVLVSVSIAVEAFHRFSEPPHVSTDNLLLVAVLGFLVNLLGIFFFHDDHADNDNMKGVFLHVLADTLGSVGVILSTLIIQYFHYYIVDPICAMIISFFIFVSVFSLFSTTIPTLLQRVPPEKRKQLQYALEQIRQMPDVERVHNVHLWKNGDLSYVASFHVAVGEGASEQQLLSRCKSLLQSEGILEVAVQIEKPGFSRTRSERLEA